MADRASRKWCQFCQCFHSLPQERIAVLEEALEPFANMDDANMNDPLSKWIRVGHIKAAVAALNGGST